MTKEQFIWSLKKCGVTNTNSIPDILAHVRRIEFNNSGAIFLNPKDKTNTILEINWDLELIVMIGNDTGKWRKAIKAIELVEQVIGIATDLAPDNGTYITDNTDGTFNNYDSSKATQTDRPYVGSPYEIISKIGYN